MRILCVASYHEFYWFLSLLRTSPAGLGLATSWQANPQSIPSFATETTYGGVE